LRWLADEMTIRIPKIIPPVARIVRRERIVNQVVEKLCVAAWILINYEPIVFAPAASRWKEVEERGGTSKRGREREREKGRHTRGTKTDHHM
jgi:hypothetical protein